MSEKLTILVEDLGAVSDGYHTFDELYEHRHYLFGLLLQTYREQAFKSRCDNKEKKIEGWFIAGLNTNHGQITYHVPMRLWTSPFFIDVLEIEFNKNYDGHTSADVLDRLETVCDFGI